MQIIQPRPDLWIPRIADPTKLDAVREMLDLEIVEQRLASLSFDYAVDRCLEKLGLRLRFHTIRELTTVAWTERRNPTSVYPEHIFNVALANGGSEHVPDVTAGDARRPVVLSTSSLIWWNATRIWAISAQDACLAAFALALDDAADIAYDARELLRTLPAAPIREVSALDRLITLARFKMGFDAAMPSTEPTYMPHRFFAARHALDVFETVSKGLRPDWANRESRLFESMKRANAGGLIDEACFAGAFGGEELAEIEIVSDMLSPARESASRIASLFGLYELAAQQAGAAAGGRE
jgi:hypothetical protein